MPFSFLADRLRDIRARIDVALARGGREQQVEIVAVTKTHGPDAVVAAWDAGLRTVGENKVQEALEKQAALEQLDRPDVSPDWHLIGHLQRNKAKHVLRFALVHSMDSSRLAEALHEGPGAKPRQPRGSRSW